MNAWKYIIFLHIANQSDFLHGDISIKWMDLCAGVHVPNRSGVFKAFYLELPA